MRAKKLAVSERINNEDTGISKKTSRARTFGVGNRGGTTIEENPNSFKEKVGEKGVHRTGSGEMFLGATAGNEGAGKA